MAKVVRCSDTDMFMMGRGVHRPAIPLQQDMHAATAISHTRLADLLDRCVSSACAPRFDL